MPDATSQSQRTAWRPIRRCLSTVGVGAAGAAGITVAISWYCAFHQDASTIVTSRPSGPWPYSVPSDWPPEPNRLSTFEGDGAFSVLHSSCSNDTATEPDDYPKLLATAEYHQVIRRTGWPFLALASLHLGRSEPAPTAFALSIQWASDWRSGIQIGPDRINPRMLPGRALGVLILAPGFLANTALWFGLLMAVPFARAIRRHRRRSTGRCTTCGHIRAPSQAACPECGASQNAS